MPWMFLVVDVTQGEGWAAEDDGFLDDDDLDIV
jgi:hypothetical protein